MAIRTLTARLLEEAKEAYRRQNYGPASPLLERDSGTSPKLRDRVGHSTAIFGGDQMGAAPAPSVSVPPKSQVDTHRTPGVRYRQQEVRWKTPGGIAARFSLPSERSSLKDTQNRQNEPSEPLPEVEVAATVADAAPQTGETERPELEKSTPITIELQSH